MKNANLQYTDFSGAILENANLETDLLQTNIEDAKTSKNAIMPDGSKYEE